jgi:hypothetical protein
MIHPRWLTCLYVGFWMQMIHPRWLINRHTGFWAHMERQAARAERKLTWNNAAYHRKKGHAETAQ